MAFTTDVTTDIGKVRLLIFDRNVSYPIFQDADINAFLSIEGASIKRAVALALETIGTSELLIQKVIRNLNLQTDGAALSRELRLKAKEYRDQADKDEAFSSSDGLFDWAEHVYNPASERERLVNEILRST